MQLDKDSSKWIGESKNTGTKIIFWVSHMTEMSKQVCARQGLHQYSITVHL